MNANGRTSFSGSLGTRLIKANVPASLTWKLRNNLTWPFIQGWIAEKLVAPMANKWGVMTVTGRLSITHTLANGQRVHYGVVGRRVVTTVFVNELVDQLQAEDSTWGDFKYHDSGVGTTAAAVGDTDIETTDGESRATGSQTEGASANIYKSVGTIAYTTTKAITEHVIANASTAGEIIDRHVFAAINVANGDSIEFTYELTATAGG